ncbi:Oxidoreductase swnR [Metarhizium anisopliae]
MSIAIAGSGDLARYLVEELRLAGQPVVILCRTKKSHFELPGVTQKEVDFKSVDSLKSALDGSVALISVILDYTMAYTDSHMNLIAACRQTSTCRRFIPAEYGTDTADYPDQPGFEYANHEPVRQTLREQNVLEWTLVCCGWLADYVLPVKNRYIKDIGDSAPFNLSSKRIVIPGTGKELLDVTSARDLCKALVALTKAPAGSWERYTYVSGEKTTLGRMSQQVQAKYATLEFTTKHISLNQLVNAVREAKTQEERIEAEYGIVTLSSNGGFDPAMVHKQRGTYFKDVRFRSVQELLDEVDKHPDSII